MSLEVAHNLGVRDTFWNKDEEDKARMLTKNMMYISIQLAIKVRLRREPGYFVKTEYWQFTDCVREMNYLCRLKEFVILR